MLLLKNEDKGDLIDCLILEHVLIPGGDDLLCLVHTNYLESVIEVRHGDLLDLKHIVRVKDGFEVLRRQEQRLELIQRVVVWISLVELLAFDRLEHFKYGSLRIGWLLIQDVGHQFL